MAKSKRIVQSKKLKNKENSVKKGKIQKQNLEILKLFKKNNLL